ncbi:GTP cyclohydrolase, FolE2/MptA family [Neisseriaceae bacterium JH1-16]|nr:GTP cyclohydrolase, FolE2/MptA family [Neisseriaceae bacterium JH1-16]
MHTSPIPDIQSSPDSRNLIIDKVGIKDLRHPIRLAERSGGVQPSVGLFTMAVQLPAHLKGTHMSRFVTLLQEQQAPLSPDEFERLVRKMADRLKEISQFGAHNQRSHATVRVALAEPVWIEELIELVEQQALCELYGLLRRPDEKHVTERAYENPKFVEDMVRDVAARLNADARILAYSVESENFESIHNHSAYALIEHDKRRA